MLLVIVEASIVQVCPLQKALQTLHRENKDLMDEGMRVEGLGFNPAFRKPATRLPNSNLCITLTGSLGPLLPYNTYLKPQETTFYKDFKMDIASPERVGFLGSKAPT